MSRLKTMVGKYLLTAPVIMAVTALFLWGGVVTSAAADTAKPKNAHEAYKIRDAKVDPKLSSAERAHLQRQNAIKKRQDARKFVEDAATGKLSASGGAK